MNTQQLNMILNKMITTCLLTSVLCLNLQKQHWIFQQMLQNCLKMEVNIPIKVQIALEMCLVTMCWWNQFKLGHLGNDWGWSWFTKCTWLEFFWNFEHVWSNLSKRLIHGSIVWGVVTRTHPNDANAWALWKCAMDLGSD